MKKIDKEKKYPSIHEITPEFSFDDYILVPMDISETRLGKTLAKYDIAPQEDGPWICGSAAVAAYCEAVSGEQMPYSDIDYFFSNDNLMDDYITFFEDELDTYCEEDNHCVKSLYLPNGDKVQFIYAEMLNHLLQVKPKSYSPLIDGQKGSWKNSKVSFTMQHVLSTFDFTISQIGYADGYFIMHKDTRKCIDDRNILLNLSNCKGATLGRVHKYGKKGFTMGLAEWDRLAECVFRYGPLDTFNYNDNNEAKEVISGLG